MALVGVLKIVLNLKPNMMNNIPYQWLCLKCQASHSTPWCPYSAWNNKAVRKIRKARNKAMALKMKISYLT